MSDLIDPRFQPQFANCYICIRQRAGPLVKECRGQWPRMSQYDDPFVQERKRSVRKVQTMFSRGPVRKLELMLALFGYNGTHYVLTFDDAHLPKDFKAVRRVLHAFIKKLKRWRDGKPIDYIYAIEALTTNCRYHIHLVLNDDEFPPAVVQYLWTQGFADDVPLLKWRYTYRGKEFKGYYGMAVYLNKERPDGFFIPLGRHPWGVSKALRDKLPDPEQWVDVSNEIAIPDGATVLDYDPDAGNAFGRYSVASYLLPKNSALLE